VKDAASLAGIQYPRHPHYASRRLRHGRQRRQPVHNEASSPRPATPNTYRRFNRAVTAKAQIRLVLETFRDKLFTAIFPGRTTVPKTLIFCKDDAHAEEVVTTIREVFGKGNDFAAKITYTARDPKRHLQAFRTSASLRVAVTVDMIATGTDVKPLECLVLMRDVRSASYFEQMKGRDARTISAGCGRSRVGSRPTATGRD
jgi:type I site-specific restriction endonuclease